MITTNAVDVRVNTKLTKNYAASDLHIEVDQLDGTPVSAFASPRAAGVWLDAHGFRYVVGTQGIWSRR